MRMKNDKVVAPVVGVPICANCAYCLMTEFKHIRVKEFMCNRPNIDVVAGTQIMSRECNIERYGRDNTATHCTLSGVYFKAKGSK